MSDMLVTESDVRYFLSRLDSKKPLYVDTETSGLDIWRGDRMCLISMFQDGKAAAIPFRMKQEEADLFMQCVNAEESVMGVLVEAFKEFIGHEFNAKFDLKVKRADGIYLKGVEDVYIKASLALAGKKTGDGKKQRLGLKAIARDILQRPVGDSDEIDKWFESNGFNDDNRRYDVVPEELLVKYAISDVRLTSEVDTWADKEIEKWGLGNTYRLELETMHALDRLEWEGTKVDVDACEVHRKELGDAVKAVKSSLTFDPANDNQVMAALQAAGIQLTERTEKGEISVDKDVLKNIDHDVARKTLEYRRHKKNLDFFISLLNYVDDKGFVHPSFQQFSSGKSPGRTSCTTPNLQQMPPFVREVFIAPEGMMLIGGDYSQMHFRIAANVADDPNMQAAYLGGGTDIHAHTASLIYGVPRDKVEKVQRRRAKDCNFCFLYSGGLKKFAQTAGISEEEAKPIYYGLHRAYPKAKAKTEELYAQAEKYGYIQGPSGRLRFLDDFHKAFNTVILGIEADVTKSALAKVDKATRSIGGRAAGFVHDEVQFYVPIGTSDEKICEIVAEMEDHSGKVPLTVDTWIAEPSWGKKRDLHFETEKKVTVEVKEDIVPKDVTKVNEWSLKDLEEQNATMKIRKKDGSFIYIAGNEKLKEFYSQGGKRDVISTDEAAKMILAIREEKDAV